jgi:tyrosinase
VKAELVLNGNDSASARYVTWAPSPCKVRLSDSTGAPGPVDVTLRNKPGGTGGRVVFAAKAGDPFETTLKITLPKSGAAVEVLVAGQFGRPSVDDKDVTIEVRAGTTVIGTIDLMVRIRKNANKLSTGERDRFVAALAELNDRGNGRFKDFRNMHTEDGSPEAHGAPGFLPWHRIYLLDLERELQSFDSSVALPYWRFDQAAPNLFTKDFLGTSLASGQVEFSTTNPLQFWTTDGVVGVDRAPFFNTSTGKPTLRNEAQTLGLGNTHRTFMILEGDPHGLAHVSFEGSISEIPTAARDPLFFLLHANVDRLWAKWQRQFGRFDAAQAASFDSPPGGNRIGHNLPDTMWPWNGIFGGQRPPTAPGGGLAASPCSTAPGATPRVRDALDFQGTLVATSRLGFDYDDVQFA